MHKEFNGAFVEVENTPNGLVYLVTSAKDGRITTTKVLGKDLRAPESIVEEIKKEENK